MRRSVWLAVALGVALTTAGPAMADVWDVNSDTDNGTGTDNELIHGTSQVHDVAVQAGPTEDQDWYLIGEKPRSSYEVVIDGTTGDVGYNFDFDRMSNATTVVQSYTSVTPGRDYSKFLAWQNNTANSVVEYIRVSNPACGTSCNGSDQYTIHAYETTYSIPRFNNSATQITILIIQNMKHYAISVAVHFWGGTGGYLGTSTATIVAHGALVLNTSTLGFAAGKSGVITVSNTGRYGDLSGKAVALEPATGFTFDTPMEAKS